MQRKMKKTRKRGRKPKANYNEMFANLRIHYEEVYTLTEEEKRCPACKDTEDSQFIKDKGLTALIRGGYTSPSLVSHIMYEKYADALPLYRQVKSFEPLGVRISRTTMASWIITCSQNYLKPVYDYSHRELLKRRLLMADEITIQVLKGPDRRASLVSG